MKKIDGLSFLEYIKRRLLILDGATGTFLLENGLKPGECPELFAAQNPDLLRDVQRRYLDAGSRAIYTCTLGANAIKLKDFGLQDEAEDLNIKLANITARLAGDKAFVGGDMSATGVFLRPLGELDLEEAIEVYKRQAKALERGGADFLVIETMIDIQEARAAVIAAKEACGLPVVASMTFDKHGRTLTGTGAAAAAIALICAGADVVGLNCSTGPAEMLPALADMKAVSTAPLIVKPNAGMPVIKDGRQHFNLSCEEFRKYVKPLCEAGANLIGGCCGTNPDYIRAIARETAKLTPSKPKSALPPAVTALDTVYFGKGFRIIGERINPTGKPKLKEAIITGDFDTVLSLGAEQREGGADILDVNMGVPGADENSAMKKAIETLSARIKLPLCIDTSNANVAERALRAYPGRALLNSLSCKSAHFEALLPVIKKYNPMFILLPIGDEGIPKTARERIEVIKTACAKLSEGGIDKESYLVDALVMAVSSDPQAANETLKVIKWCGDNGSNTVVGLSNGSFGLPSRSQINAAYLIMAMANGLSSAIMDPNDITLVNLCCAAEALTARDKGFARYLERFAEEKAPKSKSDTLYDCILSGKKKSVAALVDTQIKLGKSPQAVIDEMIIPALDEVGDLYERRVYFLPHLIYSAEAAHAAFERLERYITADAASNNKKKVVIATVRGDIHDIGKNLVAMLLKNHGFEVIDLGKDVPAESIISAARRHKADIIGLSALITTTAQEMEKVIELKKQLGLSAKVLVGGAVITRDYASSIGADGYAADAAGAVKIAQELSE